MQNTQPLWKIEVTLTSKRTRLVPQLARAHVGISFGTDKLRKAFNPYQQHIFRAQVAMYCLHVNINTIDLGTLEALLKLRSTKKTTFDSH